MTASDSAAHNLHHSRCARYFGRIWSLNDARPEIHNTTQSHCQRFADSSLTSELSNSGTKHQFNCGTCLCCLIAGRCRASRPLDSLWLAAYSSLFRAFAFALPQIPALGLAPPPTSAASSHRPAILTCMLANKPNRFNGMTPNISRPRASPWQISSHSSSLRFPGG
jgi:hypothetical protein